MTSEVELKEIRSLLVELNKKMDNMIRLLENNLVGCEEPLPDEVEATEEYESSKKQKKLQLVSWKG